MADSTFEEAWQAFEEEAGPALADEMQLQAPVATGTLADSQSWRDNEGTLEIVSTDERGPIALYVIAGTAPHPIDPVNAQMLHWVDAESGEDVFARHVDHPGTAPNQYNVRAWDAQRDVLVRRFYEICGRDRFLAMVNPFRKL